MEIALGKRVTTEVEVKLKVVEKDARGRMDRAYAGLTGPANHRHSLGPTFPKDMTYHSGQTFEKLQVQQLISSVLICKSYATTSMYTVNHHLDRVPPPQRSTMSVQRVLPPERTFLCSTVPTTRSTACKEANWEMKRGRPI